MRADEDQKRDSDKADEAVGGAFYAGETRRRGHFRIYGADKPSREEDKQY